MESSRRIDARSNVTRRRARRPLAHGQRSRKGAERTTRARVAAAFRRLAHGVENTVAYARSVEFYRASGHAWTRSLG